MRLLTGTSGFSYKEWKGTFYPEKLPASGMLAHYATKLSAVEINNTFYRMPSVELLEGWRAKVTPGFRFVVKAPQRITHRARLKDCAETVDTLWRACAHLGPHLGPILFQLPPYFRKDAEVLRAFVGELPDGMRAAFEFRHGSWFDDEVVDVLRDGGAALCAADTDAEKPPRMEATTSWGYLRLRRADYTADDLATWRDRVRALSWDETYAFFKHEDGGVGPRLAMELAELGDTGP